MKKYLTLGVLGLAVFALAQGRIELEARLLGQGKGKASWKVRDGRQAELEVEGEMRRVPNTHFVVTIGSNPGMNVTTNAFSNFNVEQRFGATRPTISVGDPVVVTNDAGTIVMSGTMARK